jgi:hypothetical protein
MKSIRISDEVYDAAQQVAGLMSRSLAQQVEHWVRLAMAMEACGVTTEQVQQILGGDLRAREKAFMKLGLVKQEDQYFVPREVARKTPLKFPSGSALDAR